MVIADPTLISENVEIPATIKCLDVVRPDTETLP